MAKIPKKRRLNINPETEKSSTTETQVLDNNPDIDDLKGALDITDENPTSSWTDGNEIKSEIIDLNDKTKSENKVTVDFSNQKFIDELVSKKTVKVEEEDEDDKDFKGKSAEEVRQTIDKIENTSEDNWTADDFYSVAELIITILDTFLANMMRIYAKDTSDSAYSLNDKKRKLLVKNLAAILIKYQAKFKVEFLFILSLVLFYAGPVIAARARRKEIKRIENEIIAKRAAGEPVQEVIFENQNNNQTPIVEEANYIKEETDETITEVLPAIKRSKGKQRKH